MEQNPDIVFSQFRMLQAAAIDASSIIYMRKAGYLSDLAAEIRLFSPSPVIRETGYVDLPVNAIDGGAPDAPALSRGARAAPCPALSNDQLLIAVSLNRRLPVISEDKKILMRIKNAERPYFNSLMMLNFLLFRRRISAGDHRDHFARLREFAWYGPAVLAYSRTVFAAIRADGGK